VSADEVAERVVDHALQLESWMRLAEVMPFSPCEDQSAPDSVTACRTATLLAERLRIPLRSLPATTVTGVVDALLPAEFVLSTRMHGFILALMLGCRAANLDYIEGGGKGGDLYRDWLGRSTAPSLFVPGCLRCEDFLALAELSDTRNAMDMLLDTYVAAIQKALRE
jgi:hypothetical protein